MGRRTEMQIAEDKYRIPEFLNMGLRSPSEIARRINSGRDEENHISSAGVTSEIARIKEEYLSRGFEQMEMYRHQAMEEMLLLIRKCYEGYEASRVNKITVESMKEIGTEDEYNEIMNQEGIEQEYLDDLNPFNRSGKVKDEARGEGNVAFLNAAKSAFDSLNKMRGVDGATKLAMTDTTGTQDYGNVVEVMKAKMNELASTQNASEEIMSKLLSAAPINEDDEDSIEAEVVYDTADRL